jgi:hypothetical protein
MPMANLVARPWQENRRKNRLQVRDRSTRGFTNRSNESRNRSWGNFRSLWLFDSRLGSSFDASTRFPVGPDHRILRPPMKGAIFRLFLPNCLD